MTALWESSLDAISQKQLRYDAFMSPLITQLNELVTQAANQLPNALAGVTGPGYKKRRSGAKTGYKRKSTTGAKSASKKRLPKKTTS